MRLLAVILPPTGECLFEHEATWKKTAEVRGGERQKKTEHASEREREEKREEGNLHWARAVKGPAVQRNDTMKRMVTRAAASLGSPGFARS